MAVLVYVLGRTGTGKSFSMRNFPKDKLAIINVQGKILPFKGSGQIEMTSTDDSDKIEKALDIYAKSYKSIVIDDFQYLMSNEFMRRATERGYDKFTEIAAHAWNIADKVRELPSDTIVYIMCHTDTDAEGVERLKTIGKLLDEKIYLEGMSTIVLKTVVSDGKYSFVTQNNGKDTVKSPADMFPAYAIDNDLWYVDQKIREYYDLGNTMSSDELAAADAEVTREEIKKPEKKKRGKSEDPTPVEEAPRRKRRSEDPEVQAVKAANAEVVANAGIDENDTREEIPLEEVEEPKLEEIPKRRRRKPDDTEESKAEEPAAEETPVEEAPRRRRRRI